MQIRLVIVLIGLTALTATILLLLGRTEFADIISTTDTPVQDSTGQQTEFYLQQAQTRRFHHNAPRFHQFDSEQIEYFKTSDTAIARNPKLVINGENGPVWQATARNATMLAGGTGIRMQGDVKIRHSTNGMELNTEELYVIPDREYAETAKPVVIYTAHGTTTGTGMKLDLKQEKLELLADVTGVYELP